MIHLATKGIPKVYVIAQKNTPPGLWRKRSGKFFRRLLFAKHGERVGRDPKG